MNGLFAYGTLMSGRARWPLLDAYAARDRPLHAQVPVVCSTQDSDGPPPYSTQARQAGSRDFSFG